MLSECFAWQATLATITAAQEEAAVAEVSLLNFVVSDGSTLVATRFVSHEEEEAASLYYAEGSAFQVSTKNTEDLPGLQSLHACIVAGLMRVVRPGIPLTLVS